ncbi:hypothetical protein KW791_03955, partial [Candidatus Parcubacteria bacterium]|nr:hypothetical protein [Candidatus Parcubacteria bacterium]
TGGIPSPGFAGAGGRVLTLNFRAKSEGPATIIWEGAQALANDGKGTNILTQAQEASFLITSELNSGFVNNSYLNYYIMFAVLAAILLTYLISYKILNKKVLKESLKHLEKELKLGSKLDPKHFKKEISSIEAELKDIETKLE